MKLTRRELVVVVGSAAAAKAFAQTPASPAPAARDFAKEAHDNVQRNGETLAKFGIPMAVEPSFQFKA